MNEKDKYFLLKEELKKRFPKKELELSNDFFCLIMKSKNEDIFSHGLFLFKPKTKLKDFSVFNEGYCDCSSITNVCI